MAYGKSINIFVFIFLLSQVSKLCYNEREHVLSEDGKEKEKLYYAEAKQSASGTITQRVFGTYRALS